MNDFQIYFMLGVFAAVVIIIAFDLIDMAVAALLGVSLLFIFGLLNENDLLDAGRIAAGPISLLFGGMVVARVLTTTGVFDRLGARLLRATRGSGKYFLIYLLTVTTLVCAFLPNATTIILLAPIVVRVASSLRVDFVAPMILMAIVSNSAGLLTLVGDPATFLVGSSIGMSFSHYLKTASFGGLLSLLVILPLIPRLLPEVWNHKITASGANELPKITRPGFTILALLALAIMVILFVFGETLPIRIVPPEVAIIAASLALLVIYEARVEPVDKVFGDIDWKTLIFLGCMFILVQGFLKTGLIQGLSLEVYAWFGADLSLVALSFMGGISVLSSLLANIPVVAAAIIMAKGYLVAAEVVPEVALSTGFTDWPPATLPLFIAMMFGATLGGNATLIGASANIVSAGVCAAHGSRVSFGRFLRYGIPITVCQLGISALYVVAMAWMS